MTENEIRAALINGIVEAICKIDFRPSDASSEQSGMNIPKGADDGLKPTYKARLKKMEEAVLTLQRQVMQNETDIMMLWDQVNELKEKICR